MTATKRMKAILKALESFDEEVGDVLSAELQGHLDGALAGLEAVAEDLSLARL
jgi:hypothetical protein